MPTGYWKKDAKTQKKDEASKDVEGHGRIANEEPDAEGHLLKNDPDAEGHVMRNDGDADVEGHSFIMDTEMNRALARQREKDIQRDLRNESKRPFFRRGR